MGARASVVFYDGTVPVPKRTESVPQFIVGGMYYFAISDGTFELQLRIPNDKWGVVDANRGAVGDLLTIPSGVYRTYRSGGNGMSSVVLLSVPTIAASSGAT